MINDREPRFSRAAEVQEFSLDSNNKHGDIWSHPVIQIGKAVAVLAGTFWLASRNPNSDNPEPISPTATPIACNEGTPVQINPTDFLMNGQKYVNEQRFEHDKEVFQEMLRSTLNLTLPEEKRANLVLATPDQSQYGELFETTHESVYDGREYVCAYDLNNSLLFTIDDGYYVWSGKWFPDIQVHRWVDPKENAPVQELWEFYYNKEGTQIGPDHRILGDNELTTEQLIEIGNKMFRYPPAEWKEDTQFPQLKKIEGSTVVGNKKYVYSVVSGVAFIDIYHHDIEASS